MSENYNNEEYQIITKGYQGGNRGACIAEEHGTIAKNIPRDSGPPLFGRFAFNRNPRAANTTACVPRRYEFIVYTVCGLLVHIRKLIVPAVNYSACTPATAAASPHVRHCGTSLVPYSARVYVWRMKPHRDVASMRKGVERGWRAAREGHQSRRAKRAGSPKGGGSRRRCGERMRRVITPACTRLILICILIAAPDNWRFRFRVNPQLFYGGGRGGRREKKSHSDRACTMPVQTF